MNVKQLNRIIARALYGIVIVAMVLSNSTVVYAAPPSPFIGHWEAIDVDGSEMTLAIAGPPIGPFQITWTDDYIGYCGGEAGIVRGTASLNENDPNLLEADVRLECFRSGETLDFHVTLRFHPEANTLSILWWFGQVTIWHRPGGGQVEEPPALGLRVNYGHDWVESFYEGGHTAWVTVTDGDGNLKATVEMVTEPKDYWDGETGFQSLDSVWFDGDGNPMENPPDIQPYDWVFGWVDNGASAQVQIGDISGMIDLDADSVGGTINAPWFSDEQSVDVECFDWGSGQEPPFDNAYGGSILPNGSESYYCSWGEWDIQPGQDVGVGYFGPDGNWVANAFFIQMPTFVAYLPWTIVGYDWPVGDTINISINDGEYVTQAQVGNADWDPTVVLFELWRDDFYMEAGDHIVMTDETTGKEKEVWVTNLAVTDFDLDVNEVFGTYDPAYDLLVWLYDIEEQVPETDPDAGTWNATFTELPPGAWGGATQWDGDGDGTSIDFQIPVTFFVSSTGDVMADDGDCTLREAIIAANTNSPSGEAEGECPAGTDTQSDTILLAADQTYSLTIDSTYEDDAWDGDLDIWDNSAATDLIIMVEGGGNATISQDAGADDRVFDILGATVNIKGLTLTGGSLEDAGGGIQNTGNLTVDASVITDNSADIGGGIASWEGIVKLNATTVSGNSGQYAGGGILNSGTLIMNASNVSGNTSSEGGGGGIWNNGDLKIAASTISENEASGGGGLFNEDSGVVKISANTEFVGNIAYNGGGGIVNSSSGMLTVESSTISGNKSYEDGGGIQTWEGATTIIQNGSEVNDNSADWGGGGLWNVGALIVKASTISGNSASDTGGGGGGITSGGDGTLTVSASTVNYNTAGWGGGIFNWGNGSALIENGSTVSDNTASNDGGGLWNQGTLTIQDGCQVTDNTAGGGGGGIVNGGGTLDVQNSTVAHNSAGGPGGIANWWGGIATLTSATIADNSTGWAGGGIENWGTMTIDASTISGNSSDVFGGGIMNSADLTLTNSTINGNTSVHGGGGINNEGGLTITNSTLSANTDGQGGAIYNSGTAWITEDNIENNTASDGGGGLFNTGTMTVVSSTVSGNWAPYGGGLFNWIGGMLTIDDSTVFNNSANEGGGLHNKEGSISTIQNGSIFSGNYAEWGGGGIDNWGTITMTGSILRQNMSPGEGDAIANGGPEGSTASVTASCIVGNGDTAVFNVWPDLLNFTGNWWGDASGPSGLGPGTGDSVSDYVDFSGWLLEPPAICAP